MQKLKFVEFPIGQFICESFQLRLVRKIERVSPGKLALKQASASPAGPVPLQPRHTGLAMIGYRNGPAIDRLCPDRYKP